MTDSVADLAGSMMMAVAFSFTAALTASMAGFRRDVRSFDQNTILIKGISTSFENAVAHLTMDVFLSFCKIAVASGVVDLLVDLDYTGVPGFIVFIIDQMVSFLIDSVFHVVVSLIFLGLSECVYVCVCIC